MTEAATDIETTSTDTAVDTSVDTSISTGDFSIPEAYRSVTADDGTTQNAWSNDLKTTDDVWKKLAGSQKLIGDRGAFIPKEGATSDEVNAFLSKLDPYSEQLKSKYAPKAPEAYEFSDLGLPEGTTIADSVTEKFSAIAKAHGLSNDQADSVRKEWITHELEQESNRQAS